MTVAHGREREAHEDHPHNRAAQPSGKIERESNVLRRDLLKSGLVGSAALASSIGVAGGDERELDAVAAELSKELSKTDWRTRFRPIRPSPNSPRASTARSCSAAAANITSPGTAASSTAFTTKAST
jgi:hypothetical protein